MLFAIDTWLEDLLAICIVSRHLRRALGLWRYVVGRFVLKRCVIGEVIRVEKEIAIFCTVEG